MQGLARIRGWLLSIKHEQEISNHFDQRLAEKEFGGKADEAESEDKEEQKKIIAPILDFMSVISLGPDGGNFININRESARRDRASRGCLGLDA